MGRESRRQAGEVSVGTEERGERLTLLRGRHGHGHGHGRCGRTGVCRRGLSACEYQVEPERVAVASGSCSVDLLLVVAIAIAKLPGDDRLPQPGSTPSQFRLLPIYYLPTVTRDIPAIGLARCCDSIPGRSKHSDRPTNTRMHGG
jgi:hypothetical protein